VLCLCWFGDRKGIQPVNNLAPAVPKRIFVRSYGGHGITRTAVVVVVVVKITAAAAAAEVVLVST